MPEQPVPQDGQPQPTTVGPPYTSPPSSARDNSGRPAPRGALPLLFGGSLRLFRVAGIDVFMHWSWVVVAIIRINMRMNDHSENNLALYSTLGWYVLEYLALFAIVLMHEFGHVLACRQVGGVANRIVLWPLGGVAFVSPPPRPGAFLWSIAAGPLVNVALVPVTFALWWVAGGWHTPTTDLHRFFLVMMTVNLGLLFFNLVPIFPLDGGQIFHALLWFIIGRAQSLMVASIIGLVFGLGITLLAVVGATVGQQPAFWWLAIMFGFAAFASLAGFAHARLLMQKLDAPRRKGMACPSCGSHPPAGEFWACDRCRNRFDTFAHRAQCPGCGKRFDVTMCVDCLARHPFPAWLAKVAPVDRPRGKAEEPLDVIPVGMANADHVQPLDVEPADIVKADRPQPLDVVPVDPVSAQPVHLSRHEAQPQDLPPLPPAASSESGEHQSP